MTSPTDIYLFNINNQNTRAICVICSKLTIKTPEHCQWRKKSSVSIYSSRFFEHIKNSFPLSCFYQCFQPLNFRTMIWIKSIFTNAYIFATIRAYLWGVFFSYLHSRLCLSGLLTVSSIRISQKQLPRGIL